MIEILFDCKLCGLKERMVPVRYRRPGEDLKAWMDQVARCVSLSHGAVSPQCRATSITALKIPHPNVKNFGVGMDPLTACEGSDVSCPRRIGATAFPIRVDARRFRAALLAADRAMKRFSGACKQLKKGKR